MKDRKSAPMSYTPNKGARRRLKLLLFAFAGLLLWAGLTVTDQMSKIEERKQRLNALETKVEELHKQISEAKKEISLLNDKEYQEEKARRDLQYAKPGELVFDLPEPESP